MELVSLLMPPPLLLLIPLVLFQLQLLNKWWPSLFMTLTSPSFMTIKNFVHTFLRFIKWHFLSLQAFDGFNSILCILRVIQAWTEFGSSLLCWWWWFKSSVFAFACIWTERHRSHSILNAFNGCTARNWIYFHKIIAQLQVTQFPPVHPIQNAEPIERTGKKPFTQLNGHLVCVLKTTFKTNIKMKSDSSNQPNVCVVCWIVDSHIEKKRNKWIWKEAASHKFMALIFQFISYSNGLKMI